MNGTMPNGNHHPGHGNSRRFVPRLDLHPGIRRVQTKRASKRQPIGIVQIKRASVLDGDHQVLGSRRNFQISKMHGHKSAFIVCFVQAYCVLHVQFVSCSCQQAFDVRFWSRHLEVKQILANFPSVRGSPIINQRRCFIREARKCSWQNNVSDHQKMEWRIGVLLTKSQKFDHHSLVRC